MIRYEWIKDGLVAVYLEDKRIGKIKKNFDGWSYYPLGHRPREAFKTLDECKKSLESE